MNDLRIVSLISVKKCAPFLSQDYINFRRMVIINRSFNNLQQSYFILCLLSGKSATKITQSCDGLVFNIKILLYLYFLNTLYSTEQ